MNGTKLASSFYQGSRKGYNLNNDFINRYTCVDPATGVNLTKPSSTVIAQYGSIENIYNTLNTINANASVFNPCVTGTMSITDYAVEDGSFLRLQTLTLGYTLPKYLIKKVNLSNVRFYATAYNLLTITGYSGSDPETDTSSKKNPMCPGIDYAAYPKSRSFVFGVNVSF